MGLFVVTDFWDLIFEWESLIRGQQLSRALSSSGPFFLLSVGLMGEIISPPSSIRLGARDGGGGKRETAGADACMSVEGV